MKTIFGLDGEYTVWSRMQIEHRKTDGTTVTYGSTMEIHDLSDRRKIEEYLKEKEAGGA